MDGSFRRLSPAYIESGALGENMRADALHIAMATVAGVDVLAYNAVNGRIGYGPLEIRTRKELGDDEQDRPEAVRLRKVNA